MKKIKCWFVEPTLAEEVADQLYVARHELMIAEKYMEDAMHLVMKLQVRIARLEKKSKTD